MVYSAFLQSIYRYQVSLEAQLATLIQRLDEDVHRTGRLDSFDLVGPPRIPEIEFGVMSFVLCVFFSHGFPILCIEYYSRSVWRSVSHVCFVFFSPVLFQYVFDDYDDYHVVIYIKFM